jgi:hypothetical protein
MKNRYLALIWGVCLATSLVWASLASAGVVTVNLDTAILNAGKDPLTYNENENSILDSDEFAVISAILADTGAYHHDAVHSAWTQNRTRMGTDLGMFAGLYADALAAYMTLGDSVSVAGVVDTAAGVGLVVNPANYDLTNVSLLGGASDADADSKTNIQEYDLIAGTGGPSSAKRAQYITDILPAGGPAEGEPPAEGQPAEGEPVEPPVDYAALLNGSEGPLFAQLLGGGSLGTVLTALGWSSWADFDLEGLEYVIAGVRPMPGDGLPDAYQAALFAFALQSDNARYHATALAVFQHNKSVFLADVAALGALSPQLNLLGGFSNLWPALMSIDSGLLGTLNAIVVSLTGGATGLPSLVQYEVMDSASKASANLFAADGDYDGDGKTNLEEYETVQDAGGDIDKFVVAASDPNNLYLGNPELPAFGFAGLALLALLPVVRGVRTLRRM